MPATQFSGDHGCSAKIGERTWEWLPHYHLTCFATAQDTLPTLRVGYINRHAQGKDLHFAYSMCKLMLGLDWHSLLQG